MTEAILGIALLISMVAVVSFVAVFLLEGLGQWLLPGLTRLETRDPIVRYVLWCERFWYTRLGRHHA